MAARLRGRGRGVAPPVEDEASSKAGVGVGVGSGVGAPPVFQMDLGMFAQLLEVARGEPRANLDDPFAKRNK